MNEERLVDIETKIAYQEHMISELNDVLCQQQTIIEELKKTVESLKNRLIDLGSIAYDTFPGSEKPPHY